MKDLGFFRVAQFRVKSLIYRLAFLSVLLVGCKDDPAPSPEEPGVNPLDTITNFTGLVVPKTGAIKFSMDYQYDANPITFASKNYVNAGNDTFTINALRHYLSNITLVSTVGSKVNLGTYHLLDALNPNSSTFTVDNVPAGHYKSMQISLGVDSARNYGGLQEGALDPSWGMFWTWNTGYIFFRINGNRPQGKSYSYDIGGSEHLVNIGMDLNSYKIKSILPKVGFKMNVNELFQNPDTIRFEQDGAFIHSNTDAPILKLKANMADMVTIQSILP
jgi:hypothetical protein